MSAEADIMDAPELTKGRSPWADARRRFFRNKAAVFSLLVLIAIGFFSIFGLSFTEHNIRDADFFFAGNPVKDAGPNWETGRYFGFDADGRDLYARTVIGTRISLMVGIVGALVSVFIGTLYGATAGYVGGRTDNIMMRFVDIMLSIPYMFVLIILLVIFGRSIFMLFVGIGLISWLDMARIVRGQTLSIKNTEFVEAARATGVATPVIIWRHIIPNLLGVVAVYATLLVPQMIIFESFISFLGLGVQDPYTSLGALLDGGAGAISHPGVRIYGEGGDFTIARPMWQLYVPLFFFVTTLFALFFFGDGLRDALDPKDR